MQQQIFTDGIGKISVIGGVVRLDFMVYAPSDPDAPQGQPRQMFTHQVLMGVDAFMRASSQCAEAVKQLQAASQQAPLPQPAPKPAPAPQPAPPQQPMAAAPAHQTMTAAPAETLAPQRKPEASPWTANLKPVAPMRPFP